MISALTLPHPSITYSSGSRKALTWVAIVSVFAQLVGSALAPVFQLVGAVCGSSVIFTLPGANSRDTAKIAEDSFRPSIFTIPGPCSSASLGPTPFCGRCLAKAELRTSPTSRSHLTQVQSG